MKKIYIIISLILFSVFNAQIVNIPDANFKAFLLAASSTNSNNLVAFNSANQPIVIDNNGDGEIQTTEANNVYKLLINDPLINSLVGINGFSNLSIINVYSLDITTLDLSGMPNLSLIDIESLYELTSFNINNCPSLQTLKVHSCKMPSTWILNSTSLKEFNMENSIDVAILDISGCSALQELKIKYTNIDNLNLSNLSALKNIEFDSNSLLANVNFHNLPNLLTVNIIFGPFTQLDLSNNTSLTKITCSHMGGLQNLNISGCTGLKELTVTDSGLTSIDLSTNNQLTGVNLQENELNSLDVSNLSFLTGLNCSMNNLTSLDLTNLSLLINLNCEENNITTLDTSHNPLIYNVNCKNNNITQMTFKNGNPSMFFNVDFQNNPNLQYICCDPEDISYFTDRLPYFGYANSNVVVNTYCSFTPGGTIYTIQGNAKYDYNNNGCDINDVNIFFQKFNVTDGTTPSTFTANSVGHYSLPIQAGTYIINPVLENPSYFNISPSSFTANFPTQVSPLTQNFCLTANGTHNDLEITIIPIESARPGFDTKYRIVYKNKGTTTQSGTLIYNYNDDLMNYLNSTIAPNSQSTGILSWNFANLLPFETREIMVTFKLNTPTQTPALNGGDVLHYTVEINGATDDTPADNTFTLNQAVVNSFDPNDKTCLEGTSITQAKVGDYVHYLIRFENTGTANAHNIVVKDEIDATKFDISSLVSLHGSHNFVTRVNSNVVEFIFENIQLPFDDANNDGYVSFKIKTKSNLVMGDSFSNTAKIYFDYNAPIITNTSTTAVQNTLGTSETNNNKIQFSIYPNPVKDVLFIKSKENIIKAEIYDVAGRILSSMSVTDNSINTSELTKGNYMIKLFTKDNSTVQKFIKN